MIASVYHAKNPNFDFSIVRPTPNWPDDFIHVAKVDVKDKTRDEALVFVFQLTNHIDSDWTENIGVVWVTPEIDKVRSTSVGDVVGLDGKNYLCEHVGWSEIEECL